MYLRFCKSYYQIPREKNELLFQLNSFLKVFTLVIIHCSQQNESVKNDTVDVRIWIQRECTREYNLLPYHIRPRD